MNSFSLNFNVVTSFCFTNFLPIGFGIAFIISLSYPLAGTSAASLKFADGGGVIEFFNNCAVFLVSGL